LKRNIIDIMNWIIVNVQAQKYTKVYIFNNILSTRMSNTCITLGTGNIKYCSDHIHVHIYLFNFFKTRNCYLLLISLGSLCIFAKMWRSRSCTSNRYFRCFEFEHVLVGPEYDIWIPTRNVLSFLLNFCKDMKKEFCINPILVVQGCILPCLVWDQ
jgi:hypothetical protein